MPTHFFRLFPCGFPFGFPFGFPAGFPFGEFIGKNPRCLPLISPASPIIPPAPGRNGE